MTSSISLASNALLLLGHSTIASFTEASAGATIAANLYETSYLGLLTSHRWRFATKKERLARLTATPINDYSYMFQIPSDCIHIIKVDTRRYTVVGDKVYANERDLYMDYIHRVTEDMLPPYFVKMMEFFLAVQFAVPLTGDMEKGKYYSGIYLNELKKAKFADSTQQPATPVLDNAYVDIRH